MNAIAQPAPSEPCHFDIAVRLADEGIPVLAIARAVRVPSEDIYQALRDAIARGSIVEMPKDDWPSGTNRSGRQPFAGTVLETEEALRTAITRYLKASPLEAAMLALMLKRDEVTKEQLHGVIEAARPPGREITEIKMVDVMICKLRKKLKTYDIEIQTMWGLGYYITHEMRAAAIAKLLAMRE